MPVFVEINVCQPAVVLLEDKNCDCGLSKTYHFVIQTASFTLKRFLQQNT